LVVAPLLMTDSTPTARARWPFASVLIVPLSLHFFVSCIRFPVFLCNVDSTSNTITSSLATRPHFVLFYHPVQVFRSFCCPIAIPNTSISHYTLSQAITISFNSSATIFDSYINLEQTAFPNKSSSKPPSPAQCCYCQKTAPLVPHPLANTTPNNGHYTKRHVGLRQMP
jgi:hypothetical protein